MDDDDLTLIPVPDPGEAPARESPYTERVTLRVWDAARKRFYDPLPDVDAYRREADGGLRFVLGGRKLLVVTGRPTKGSEITDAAGVVYKVCKVGSLRPPYPCHVRRQE